MVYFAQMFSSLSFVGPFCFAVYFCVARTRKPSTHFVCSGPERVKRVEGYSREAEWTREDSPVPTHVGTRSRPAKGGAETSSLFHIKSRCFLDNIKEIGISRRFLVIYCGGRDSDILNICKETSEPTSLKKSRNVGRSALIRPLYLRRCPKDSPA